MNPQHNLVGRKDPERNTEHVSEELNKKSPRDAVSHPRHQDEGQVRAADDGHAHSEHYQHQDHHAHMVADFRRRFWVSLVLTLPILVFSPMLQKLLGLRCIVMACS
jgi:P-type Cu2+ transporter